MTHREKGVLWHRPRKDERDPGHLPDLHSQGDCRTIVGLISLAPDVDAEGAAGRKLLRCGDQEQTVPAADVEDAFAAAECEPLNRACRELTFADSASPYHEQPRSEHGASTQESPPREQSDAADVG